MGLLSRAVALVLVLSIPAWCQTDRYMVFFADKTGTPHTISQPSTFLSAKAIQRRAKALKLVDADDLPVVPAYVTQVRATGAKAFFTTRWMNGVLVEATAAQLTAIQALPFVASTSFVAPNHRLLGGRKAWTNQTAQTMGDTDAQLRMLGLDSMHADGYRGEGVMVAVLDSGFPGVETAAPFQSLRDDGRIKMTTDFVTNSGNVYQLDDHGTNILSIMAAESNGFMGGAPKADYLLFVTEDVLSEYRVEEYNWLFAAEQADSAGADIIQSSLGYNLFSDPSMDYTISQLDGATSVISRTAGFARDRGIVVVVSAGNEGGEPWKLITPPADATGILSVGAVTVTGVRATFSSTGPTADGRIKPDVVALGTGVSVVTPTGFVTTVSGTSAAAPLVASLAAGLIQVYPAMQPTALIKSMEWSASQFDAPDNQVGFGIPEYKAIRNYNDQPHLVAVYPNPVTATMWITIPPYMNPERVTILDMQGKPVFSVTAPNITWTNSTSSLDVSSLAAGLYLVWIDGGSARYTFRFVKL